MTNSIPTSWLDSCRNAILDSPEWDEMSHSIYQPLLQTLAEDRIGHFSDLSPNEQAAYMMKLEERLSSTASYPNFMRKVSNIVDHAVTMAADCQDEHVFPNRTRLERILEVSASGAAKLIADSPDSTPEKVLQQLQVLKNVPITPTLRKFVWRLYLSVPSIRASFQEYQRKRSDILTKEELKIAEKCESILLSMHPELVSSTVLLRTMRIALCFLNKEIVPLQLSHYHLIVPPLICYVHENQDEAGATEHVLEHMVAMEETSFCSQIDDDWFSNSFLLKFYDLLKAKDLKLHQLFVTIANQQIPKTSDLLPGMKKMHSSPFGGAFEDIFQEMFRYCFVRICSISTFMFIWDQLILSRWDALPQYAIGFLMCLRSHLLQCNSGSALTHVVLRLGPHLLQSSLQQTMASAFEIQRPKAIFDNHDIQLDPPGLSSGLQPDYNLPTFPKFDVDVTRFNPMRVISNMRLWKKRSRQIAWWFLLLRDRSKKQITNFKKK